MPLVHIGLGSNLGDRRENIASAFRGLREFPGTKLVRKSSFYETRPVGGPEQGNFYNAVCAVETGMAPIELLWETQQLERRIGRRREEEAVRWGPRVIDIDILLWEDREIAEAGLTVPHPRMAERAFVLAPLAEIAGDARHPAAGGTISELLERLDGGEREGIRRISL